MAIKFTEDNFEAEVLKSDLLTVVDFYADWCGPCKMMGPIVEQMAEDYDGIVKIGKLDVDEAQGAAARYQVMSIPTLIFFKNGEVMDKVIGAVSREVLKEKIENYK